MEPKPRQWSGEHALQWCDPGIARAYRHRPPYPAETFDLLCALVPADLAPGAVLDVGCGTGFVARELARRGGPVARVDAVDRAMSMIEAGRLAPGGDHPRLRWIEGAVEEAPLAPPYALVVTAGSLHWLDWERALPRLRDVLAPGGVLAAVADVIAPAPWDEAVRRACARWSTNRDHRPYDLDTVVAELERRDLFRARGARTTARASHRQSAAEWVESFHARNGLSRDRLGAAAARRCDAELAACVAPFCRDGVVTQGVAARIVWGEPLVGPPAAPSPSRG